MPNIAAIRLADDPVLSIVRASKEQIVLSKVSFLPGVTAAEAEPFIHDYVAARDSSFDLYIKVLSLRPLVIAVSAVDKGAAIPERWWDNTDAGVTGD